MKTKKTIPTRIHDAFEKIFKIRPTKKVTVNSHEEFGFDEDLDKLQFTPWFSLSEDEENQLYKNSEFKYCGENIYHYTTIDSLVNIVKSGNFRFGNVAGMNDRGEVKSEEELLGKDIQFFYHHQRIKSIIDRYIFCASLRPDDLNQWRMYGDDGKGVCIVLTHKSGINKSDINLIVGKVDYESKVIKKIKEVKSILEKNNLPRWKRMTFSTWIHFCKSKIWKDEEEVRMVYVHQTGDSRRKIEWNKNRYGYISSAIDLPIEKLPFNVSGIILGPKTSEPLLNKETTKQFFKSSKIFSKVKVEISSITEYR